MISRMEELLTLKEARAILKCSLAYVYKLVERGHLSSVNFPNMGEGIEKPRSMVRLKRSDVAKFIKDYYVSTWLAVRRVLDIHGFTATKWHEMIQTSNYLTRNWGADRTATDILLVSYQHRRWHRLIVEAFHRLKREGGGVQWLAPLKPIRFLCRHLFCFFHPLWWTGSIWWIFW